MSASLAAPDVARALVTVENSIREHAAAQGLHAIPEGQISAMVAHARGLMATMQPSQIAALASNGSAASQVASASFSAVFTASDATAARNPNSQYAALMAGTASDDPKKAKSFLDARNADRAGSGGEGRRSDYASISGNNDSSKSLGGFTPQQIMLAKQDMAYLGLADKQSLEDLAAIRKADPKLIESIKGYHDQAGSEAEDYEKAHAEAEKAQREGREEDAKRARKRMQEIEERQRKEREHRAEQAKSPDIRKRMKRTMEKDWESCKKRAHHAYRQYSDNPEEQKDLDRTAQAARTGDAAAQRKLAKMREDAEKSGDRRKVAALDGVKTQSEKANKTQREEQKIATNLQEEEIKKNNLKKKLLATLRANA